MSKLKCIEHNRRVYVWDGEQGAVTVHREDGSRCVVNPLVKIKGEVFDPSQVVTWDGYNYLQDTITGMSPFLPDICIRCGGDHVWCQNVSEGEF